MTEEQKYGLIEKFLEEKLEEDEVITFKELLESDEDFKANVKKQLDVQNALQAIYKTNKIIRAKKRQRKFTINKRQIYLFTSLAASVTLLILFGYTYFNFKNELNNSSLALQHKEVQQKVLNDEIKKLQLKILDLSLTGSTAKNKTKLELEEKENQISQLQKKLSSSRKGPTVEEKEQIACAYLADKLFGPIKGDASLTRNSSTEFQKAIGLYYEKNYKGANLLFEKLLVSENGSKKTDVIFYYGSSCLESSKNNPNNKELLKKASELFGTIVKKPSSPLYEEAIWYLAITYLKMGRKNESIELLEEIVEAKGFKNDEAEGLLFLLK